MVKVKDEPGMAEPSPSPSYNSPPKRKSRATYPTLSHPHTHIPPHYSTHYHYCTYFSDGSDILECADGTASPAKFYFGPGFEPQQPGGGIRRPGQSQGSQYVVFFHVNPGVTISFQMGDNVEILRGMCSLVLFANKTSPTISNRFP